MEITRRGFLKGGFVLGGLLAFDSVFIETLRVTVEETVIKIAGLPREFEGFKICQITDIHHGMALDIGYVERCVRMANELESDLVVLTGDYVESNKAYFPEIIKTLARLDSRHGLFAVIGNHDHYAGAEAASRALEAEGIPLLNNGHVVIESGGAGICLAGVKDFMEDLPDATAALKGAPPDVPVILLSHHPDYSEALPPGTRIDLVIAGHTHGGQVRVPFSNYAPVVPSRYGQKYTGGLVRLASGAQVYVSRGLGAAILPVRFNCTPELTLLRLVR
ncbi:MAG: metallophosphoesterase [Deltaproteobacteria bacterium]|nr:metallophosphoesterase [Deltaproteobacteria bacterium]